MSDHEHGRMMLQLARRDYTAIRVFCEAEDVSDLTLGFFVQQAVEKALKALLSHMGRGYPKVHDLEYLLNLLQESGVVFPEEYGPLFDYTEFATTFRYTFSQDVEGTIDRPHTLHLVASFLNHIEVLAESMGGSSSAGSGKTS